MQSFFQSLLTYFLAHALRSRAAATNKSQLGGISSLEDVFAHNYHGDPCERSVDSQKVDVAFVRFMKKYHRKYAKGSSEYKTRRAMFQKHVVQVNRHNCVAGRHTWSAEVNKFADRTDDELNRLRGYRGNARPAYDGVHRDGPKVAAQLLATSASMPASQLPSSFSWRNLTAIRDVQDQGGCGSCWAFAAATTLRAHSEIWLKKPRKFSVQQIVSCTPNPRECGGTGGCNGATAELAMDYVYKHGCRTEAQLPYNEEDGTCPDKKGASFLERRRIPDSRHKGKDAENTNTGMTGWTKLPENKLEPLMAALVQNGPVSVSISAGYAWNTYGTGILGKTACPKDAIIDHAVVLIGYGEARVEKKDVPYWLLLNSWGYDWGEDGYIRMERHMDKESGYCGTDNDPQMGSGCKGGPSKVRVCGMCGILYDTVIPHFEDHKADKSDLTTSK